MGVLTDKLNNLLNDYISGSISNDQLKQYIKDKTYDANNYFSLDDLFVRCIISLLQDSYDFPSDKSINGFSDIINRRKEYTHYYYINIVHAGIDFDIDTDKLYGFLNELKDFTKYTEAIKDFELNNFKKESLNRPLQSVIDILARDLAILLDALPYKPEFEIHINSIYPKLTIPELIEKIERYIDYLSGKKSFLFSAYYGIDSTVYTIT
jgi:hypothetical protein